jgi:hypothetical protein
MRTLDFGNLQIWIYAEGNKEAVIATHGGYTPRRGFFRRGSGKSTIPANVELVFYTGADGYLGGGAQWFMQGYPAKQAPIPAHGITENYSLTYDDKIVPKIYSDHGYDLIVIREEGAKAHLNDVWAALKAKNRQYSKIHCFFCRVNKLLANGKVES